MLPPVLPDIDLTDPTSYRSIDGSGNNQSNLDWGAAGEQLLRLFEPDYADGISALAGADRPNPRDISNAFGEQLENMPSDRKLSGIFWSWGQLLAHDVVLVTQVDEYANIPLGPDDLGGVGEIPFKRSIYDETTGTGVDNPRQQINLITAFVDASFVYGSDAETADLLRRNDGSGQLWEGEDGLLPTNGQLGVDANPANDHLFVAGDIRANEQAPLSAMHTLFLREHNRLASYIAEQNPTWSDEKIYQTARAIVGAEVQAITFNEFLPALLGTEDGIRPYMGYDDSVNPGIANVFEASAFRLGHTLLQNVFLFIPSTGETVDLPLANCFFDPSCLRANGIEATLLGMIVQDAQILDTKFVDAVRNNLITDFGVPIAVDLVSLNIQRGRDHGIGSYSSIRQQLIDMGWITGSSSPSDEVLAAYGGSSVDLFIGALSEEPYRDSLVGEVLHVILREQFERLRDGDRFWYEREGYLDPALVDWLNQIRLSDIIVWNTGLDLLQDFAFFTLDYGFGAAQTPNQRATALYFDQLPLVGLDGYDIYSVGVYVGWADDIPLALDQLHGGFYDAFTQTGLDLTRGVAENVMGHVLSLRDGLLGLRPLGGNGSGGAPAGGGKISIWGHVSHSWNQTDAAVDSPGYDSDIISVIMGVDFMVSNALRLGIFGSYNDADMAFTSRPGEGELTSWLFGAYVDVRFGMFGLDAAGGFGDLNIDADRVILFHGVDRVAHSEHDGDSRFAYIRATADLDIGNGWRAIPEIGLYHASVEQEGFTEAGADAVSLMVDPIDEKSVRIFGGLNIIGGGLDKQQALRPYLRIGVSHELKDDPREIVQGVVGSTSQFTVIVDVPGDTLVTFGAGLEWRVSRAVLIRIDYAGEQGSRFSRHAVGGTARVVF